jgi:hypothetical protein
VLRNNLLAEAQYSERRFEFAGGGGTSTDIIDSPFYSPSVGVIYDAPYFDATDPEQRNNRQFTGNITSFIERAGRHEVKAGYEFFRSQNTGGNSQSSTDWVYYFDYLTDAAGCRCWIQPAGRCRCGRPGRCSASTGWRSAARPSTSTTTPFTPEITGR